MQLQFLWIFPGTYQLCERKIMRFFRGKENNGLFTITGEKLTGVIFGSCFNPWRFAIRHGLWDRATPLPRLWWRRSGNPGEPNKINNLENHWTILSWSSLIILITIHHPNVPKNLSVVSEPRLLLNEPCRDPGVLKRGGCQSRLLQKRD